LHGLQAVVWLGGDEFAVVVDGTDREGVQALADPQSSLISKLLPSPVRLGA
jgi:GGDEF domain-containing protein